MRGARFQRAVFLGGFKHDEIVLHHVFVNRHLTARGIQLYGENGSAENKLIFGLQCDPVAKRDTLSTDLHDTILLARFNPESSGQMDDACVE